MFEIYRGELIISRKEGNHWRVAISIAADRTTVNKSLTAAMSDARLIIDHRQSARVAPQPPA